MSSHEKPNRPINEWYVDWANSLDSAGKDSGPVLDRLLNDYMIDNLEYALKAAVNVSRINDRVKKHLFYGKDYTQDNTYRTPSSFADDYETIKGKIDHNMVRLIHAVLGKIDEAGELAQQLFEHLYYGKALDVTNIIEETGDSNWYDALIAKWAGYDTFDPIWEANYRKLITRYPEGAWQDTRSLKRDLDAERKALEEPVVVELNPVKDAHQLYRIRTTDSQNKPVWVLYDKEHTIWGSPSDTKLSIMRKWIRIYGDGPYKITAYEGMMRRSEAAVTMAEDKNPEEFKRDA